VTRTILDADAFVWPFITEHDSFRFELIRTQVSANVDVSKGFVKVFFEDGSYLSVLTESCPSASHIVKQAVQKRDAKPNETFTLYEEIREAEGHSSRAPN
jgi:hypothetical protein